MEAALADFFNVKLASKIKISIKEPPTFFESVRGDGP
jgi:hypothetical protein